MMRTQRFVVLILAVFLSVGQKASDAPVSDKQASTFQVKTDLLSLRQDIQVVPQDRKIGPLRQTGGDSPEILTIKSSLLVPFFEGLIDGIFPTSLVIEENSIPVKRDLEETVMKPEFKTVFYRIGILNIKGDSITVSFRIKGEIEDFTGTLYVKYYSDHWLIEDVEIGMSP